MTSKHARTIGEGEDCASNTKDAIVDDYASEGRQGRESEVISLSRGQTTDRALFDLRQTGNSSSFPYSDSPIELDQGNYSPMTKRSMGGRNIASTPIDIPKLKITNDTDNDESTLRYSRRVDCPINSVGDAAYDSPSLPRPSKDFSHVMIKLKRGSDIQRVRSYDNVGVDDSDSESCNSSINGPISSSLPPVALGRIKGRRTVHFDERTITVTADLGESAARFRSQWRKKRAGVSASPPTRFGESKNISMCHDETSSIDSPVLQRSLNGKSIFDVCHYSSYGRYT